jgi:hypothetical protein
MSRRWVGKATRAHPSCFDEAAERAFSDYAAFALAVGIFLISAFIARSACHRS